MKKVSLDPSKRQAKQKPSETKPKKTDLKAKPAIESKKPAVSAEKVITVYQKGVSLITCRQPSSWVMKWQNGKKNHKQKHTQIMRPSKEWKWQVSWPWKLVSIVSESTYNRQKMRKEFQINSKIQYHKNLCRTHSNSDIFPNIQGDRPSQKWPIKPLLTPPPPPFLLEAGRRQ